MFSNIFAMVKFVRFYFRYNNKSKKIKIKGKSAKDIMAFI